MQENGLQQSRHQELFHHRVDDAYIATGSQLFVISGAGGFIGNRLVHTLLTAGFRNLRCLVRPTTNRAALESVIRQHPEARVDLVEGNLLSPAACERLTSDAAVIYHLAAGRGVKSYPDAFANSVVTTRNLLSAAEHARCQRFVNVSSFSVYSNRRLRRRDVLDETCEVEQEPIRRGDAYSYAKVKQDECVTERAARAGVPFVSVRPGVVYGPGKEGLQGRVGIDTFGVFLHLGGGNRVPLSYVDNCADALALAGLVKGVDGEVFNIVDDDLPSARELLRLYKRHVRSFASVRVPYRAFYAFSWFWESYSEWSQGQLPPTFNRRSCETYWKGNRYSNAKIKDQLGWFQRVPTAEGLRRYLDYQVRRREE